MNKLAKAINKKGNSKRNMNPFSHHQEGFTLIELLIVIAIIGILTTLLMVNFIGIRQRARDAERKSDLRQIQAALELYRADTGTYPSSPLPACGAALTNNGTNYMTKIPCDPLNSGEFIYSYTSTGTTYDIFACLENVNDSQKDPSNNSTYCSGGTTDWSYTVINP